MPRRRRLRRLLVLAMLLSVPCAYALWTYRPVTPPTEIFRGVTYSCERLPDDPQGGGMLYLIKVDLAAPGVGVYVTPLDAHAVSCGWEYRLKYAGQVLRDEQLAVVVNGPLFTSDSSWRYAGGDLARTLESVISDHHLNHPFPYYCWMLWLDDDMTPHVGDERPPQADELNRARFGIGTQMRILIDGKVNPWGSTLVDRRTVVGIDPKRKLLWLACFQKASFQYAAKILADHGATDAVILDGGASTTMAIGRDATAIHPGTITGGWRPAAVHLGIRAQPLK